ncbi:MAG TPA: iron chelate uptake ABC transporter family permease subunit [Armatimonadaceae bacterium]|jgi:manganese/zinc/iron transport system permease protein|nr:iron chelate uptake ABC transporter family permease subunit [Armatimonadaceae bacterium]
MNVLRDLFLDYTLRNIALGAAVLGLVSGVLGSFAVLRRQGLMGDALSHAALPGICLAYLLTGSKAPLVLMLGAAAAGWLGMVLILRIVRHTRIDPNSALGIVLTVFFGFGVVLLTVLQKRNDAGQAGLDKFLFGQAAAMTQEQVATMAVLGGAALLVVALLYKEFKLLAFDPEFARSLALPTRSLDLLLTSLLVVAVVIGLNTVGVVLMSAMLVAPGAAARQWTDSLSKMLALAGAFGAASGIAGAVLSVTAERIPTGPVIILCVTLIVIVSLLFGSARGLVWEWLRQARHRREMRAAMAAEGGTTP